MRFNAFDQITPSIDNTKELLLPFSFKRWLKLGFISLLAGGGRGSGFNGGGNFGGNSGEFKEVVSNAASSFKETIGIFYYLILPIIIAVVAFGLILTYVTSVFAFIFLEVLDKKDVRIKKSWHQNKGLGYSFFMFRIIIGLIVLGVILVVALPMIIPLVQQGFASYFSDFSLWNIAWIIPMIIILILFFIIVAIFMSLVYHFSLIHMYFKKMPAWESIKATFKDIKNAKLEVLVFLLAQIVIGIVVGLGAIIVVLISIIPILVLAVPFVLIFVFLVSAFGWTIPVIVGVVITAIAYLLFVIFAFSVIFLPVSAFNRYFSIRNYKGLMKTT